MRLSNSSARIIWISVCIAMATCVAFPQVAYAYVDPGTGSFVLQAVIAAIVSVSFAIKAFWGKIKARLTKKDQEKPYQ